MRPQDLFVVESLARVLGRYRMRLADTVLLCWLYRSLPRDADTLTMGQVADLAGEKVSPVLAQVEKLARARLVSISPPPKGKPVGHEYVRLHGARLVGLTADGRSLLRTIHDDTLADVTELHAAWRAKEGRAA